MSAFNTASEANTSRQSPFRRQPSTNSPSTARASTPASSPTKPSLLSPGRPGSLSPEKTSPFVRRPSQNSQTSERATSPFAQSSSSLHHDVKSSPSRHGLTSRRVSPVDVDDAEFVPPSPLRRLKQAESASPTLSTPSPFDGTNADGPHARTTSQANLRPVPQRNLTSSTTSTIRQPNFTNTQPAATAVPPRPNGAYNQIPAALLRTFRESFEVLDANATGTLDPSSLPLTLEQLGLPADPSTLASFFPAGRNPSINLATYLDTLSTPFAQLSPPDELAAAFAAFDVDDSGQIDVRELREAVLRTLPEPGEANEGARLAERDVDAVLGEFVGRRVFGAKGVSAPKAGAAAKGEVFRWREFVGNLSGGGVEVRQDGIAA